MKKKLVILFFMFLGVLFFATTTTFAEPFDGQGDNQTDDFGYYYGITGGKFPTGNIPNGNNGSGGTFRYIYDDPYWGSSIQTWHKDDWFPTNAGLALTLVNDGVIEYDNNGIEDGSYDDYYEWLDSTQDPSPGLYMGYCMSNNYDWIYATYFKLEEQTTFDTIIGYFDGNGYYGYFDPFSPFINYRMNFWSSYQDIPGTNANSYMPVVESFTGDAFSTDETSGTFEVSDTGVNRVFPAEAPYNGRTDPIYRLVFTLDEPITLTAGVYFFSHDAVISPIAGNLEECMSEASNHGKYLKCITKTLSEAVESGVITAQEMGEFITYSAQSDIGMPIQAGP